MSKFPHFRHIFTEEDFSFMKGKKSLHSLLCAALAVAMLLSMLVVPASAASVITCDFEESDATPPPGWNYRNSTSAQVTSSTAEKHGGSRSIKIEDTSTSAAPGLISTGLSPISGTKEYLASVWIKIASQSKVGAFGMALYAGNSATRYSSATPADGWKKFSAAVVNDTAPDSLTVLFATKNATTGTAYYDDLTIEPLNKENAMSYLNELLAASALDSDQVMTLLSSQALSLGAVNPAFADRYAAVLQAERKNRGTALTEEQVINCVNAVNALARELPLVNGGFENGTTGWIPENLDIDCAVTTDKKVTGTQSLLIHDTNATISHAMRSEKVFGVREGYTYVLSGSMYGTDSTAKCFLKLTFWDNEGLQVGSPVAVNYQGATSSTNRWKALTVSAVAPVGAVACTATLCSGETTTCDCYFDDVHIYELPAVVNTSFAFGTAGWTGSGISVSGDTLTVPANGTAVSDYIPVTACAKYLLKANTTGKLTFRFFNSSKAKIGNDYSLSGSAIFAPKNAAYAQIVLNAGEIDTAFSDVRFALAPYGTSVADGTFSRGTGISPWTLSGAAIQSGALSITSSTGKADSQPIPVVEGKDYVFSADISGSGKVTVTFWIDGKTSSGTAEFSSSGSGFKTVSQKITVPNAATTKETLFATLTLSGNGAQFKNVDVIALSSSLSNPSFENVNSVNSGTFPLNWKPYGAVAAYPAMGDGQFTSGVKGLALEAFGNGGVRSVRIPAVAGKEYEASVQARATGSGYSLNIEFWDSDLNAISGSSKSQSVGVGGFGKVSVAAIAPENAAYVSLGMSGSSVGDAVAYFDDASLTPVVREIYNNPQLFIDDYMVAGMTQTVRTFHPAEKHGSVLMNGLIYGNVIFDEEANVYKMWYNNNYATSTDGLTWTKIATVAVKNGTATAPHAEGATPSVETPSVFKLADGTYRMVATPEGCDSTHGYYCLYESTDGITWKCKNDKIIKGTDVISVAYDEVNGIYIALYKVPNGKRTWRVATSTDLEHWSVGARMYSVSLPQDSEGALRADSYGGGIYPVGDSYVGFDWLMRITEGSMHGNLDTRLLFSRDLTEDWQRPMDEPLLPNGESGAFDAGQIYTAAYPIRVGDELWLYYTGRPGDHGVGGQTSKISIAKWRYNGFASLDTGAAQGSVTTEPFVLRGQSLHVNAKVSGALKVELLDEGGNPISGYSADKCFAVADGVDSTVEWQSGSDLSALQGQTVALRFVSTNTELYSFTIEDTATNPFAELLEGAESGDTVTLTERMASAGKTYKLPAGVTLDLNGNALYANIVCEAGACIKDSSGDHSGTLEGVVELNGNNGGWLPLRENGEDAYHFYPCAATFGNAQTLIGSGDATGQIAFVFDLAGDLKNAVSSWLEMDNELSVTVDGTITATEKPFFYTPDGGTRAESAMDEISGEYSFDYSFNLTDAIKNAGDGNVNNVYALFTGLDTTPQVQKITAQVKLKRDNIAQMESLLKTWRAIPAGTDNLTTEIFINWAGFAAK